MKTIAKELFEDIISYLQKCLQDSKFAHTTYIVGGAVRDYVMENPIKDIDLVVEMSDGGIDLANYLYQKGLTTSKPVIYETYGTAMFHLREYPDIELEVVQTRGEQYHDKTTRNPVVKFATLMEDCVRRDLTINALYLRIYDGKILDLTSNAINDISMKICRTTNSEPDIVFNDDPLRILRVIRFACRYNFIIETNTFNSMKKFVERLSIISQERITEEFSKIITGPDAVYGLSLIKDIGAMQYIIPELVDTFELEQNKYHIGTVWAHSLQAVKINEYKDDLVVVLACLLHDIGKTQTLSIDEKGGRHFYEHEIASAAMVKDILTRMKYPNHIVNDVTFIVSKHMFTKHFGDDLHKMKMKTFNKFVYSCKNETIFNQLMALIDADNKSHSHLYCLTHQVSNMLNIVGKQKMDGTFMVGYELPIDGYDVMETTGIKSGPDVKKYLDFCLKLAFVNPKITREECIKKIKNLKVKYL